MRNNIQRDRTPYKHYKIIIGGDGAVGKSTFSKQLSGTFQEDKQQTMTYGIDFHMVDIINGSLTYGQLWDLGGQEQFRVFQDKFFEAVHIVILMYSVEWIHSFLNLNSWLQYIKKGTPIRKYLIANKIDSLHRVVTTEEGLEFAVAHDMIYFEVSALRGTGILNIKRDIANTIMNFQKKLNEEEKIQ